MIALGVVLYRMMPSVVAFCEKGWKHVNENIVFFRKTALVASVFHIMKSAK